MAARKKIRWLRLFVLLLFVLAGPGLAKKGKKKRGGEVPPIDLSDLKLVEVEGEAGPPEEDPWLRLDTRRFTLFGNVDAARLGEIGQGLESLHLLLGRLAEAESLEARLPIYVYAFKSGASMRDFRLEGNRMAAAGYLVAHPHGIYMALEADGGEAALGLVNQQYVHHLLAMHFPGLPLWLRHGVAELYASFGLREGFAEIGLPRLDYLALLARPENVLLGADRLAEIDRGSPEPRDQLAYDAQTWGLAHMLLYGSDERRRQFGAFLLAVGGGAPATRAFRESFGGGYDELMAELPAYAAREQMRYGKVPASEFPVLEAEARPLSRARVRYRLGDLLLHAHPGRGGESERHLRMALELEPECGPCHLALGHAAQLAEEREAARRHYARAAELEPESFLAQCLLGESLLETLDGRPAGAEEETALARARAAFERATELRPSYGEAWFRLGYIHGLAAEPGPEEAQALELAHALLPGRDDVALNLLLAYARADRRREAGELVARMAARGADARTLGRAKELLLQMDYRLANRLAGQSRFDDAVALLGRILAETRDPSLRQRAEQVLASFRAAAEHNRFVAGYGEVAEALEAGEQAEASRLLRQLAREARPGMQREIVQDLLATLTGTGEEE